MRTRRTIVGRLAWGGLVVLCVASLRVRGSAADEPGQRLYETRCSHCHGDEGRGGKGPRLVPFIWTYEQALELIRRPLCDMPAIPESEVSDAEVERIVAYLKAIK